MNARPYIAPPEGWAINLTALVAAVSGLFAGAAIVLVPVALLMWVIS